MTAQRAHIRPMQAGDLTAADRVYRLAFGTQFSLPDPGRFRGDSQVIRVRWTADPRPCFVAEADNRIVGGIIGMDWGSVFVLGPLTVDPTYAGRGIGRQLIEPVMDFIAARGFALAALFTFPHSPKHIHLYESYGFVPQRLTPVLSKAVVDSVAAASTPHPSLSPQTGRGLLGVGEAGAERYAKPGEGVCWFSDLDSGDHPAALAACRAVSGAVFPGLDLTREIEAIAAQGLGDTVLLDHADVAGFALCHIGAGSEAGSGTLFVKFACVRPGDVGVFGRLIDACEHLAAAHGASRIVAGVNRGRAGAYRLLHERGFRADLIGVAMHRPDGVGYNRPEVYAIDDWR
jgi:predicted N-acetyltransferase YhbS